MECRPSTRASLEMYPRKRLVTARILRALIVQLASLVVWPDLVQATVTATYLSPNLTVVSDTAGDSIVFSCQGFDLVVGGVTIVGGPVPCDGNTQIQVLAGDGDDFINFGSLAAVASLGVDGGAGVNTLVGPNLPGLTWSITGPNTGDIESSSFPFFVGSFINVQSIAGGPQNDTFAFSDGASVGGIVGNGGGVDTLDYGAYTTPIAVNLGANAPSYDALLEGDQEVPERATTGSGTATLVFNAATKSFDINVAVTGITPDIVTGFHIHRAPVGVNGPIIVDLMPLGLLVASGDGFTFSAVGVALPPIQEASLLGGLTYVNVHTPTFPAGEIRGQLIPSGAFTAVPGTATGTGGIGEFAILIAGQASDSIVEGVPGNIVFGSSGNNTIVAIPGSGGAIFGGPDDDIFASSGGEGIENVFGGTGSDLVQVNGAIGANDVLTIGAGAGGRVVLARASPVSFSFDIFDVEALSVDGVSGADTITVNSLAGIAALSSVRLFGGAGADTINAANHLGAAPLSALSEALGTTPLQEAPPTIRSTAILVTMPSRADQGTTF